MYSRVESRRLSPFPVKAIAAACLLTSSAAFGQDSVDHALGGALNARLAGIGAGFRVTKAETITTGDRAGLTIFLNDRARQLPEHFVPRDPRRGGGAGITWLNDLVDGATTNGLTAAQTAAAVTRAMNTWDSVRSTEIPLTDLAGGAGGIPFDLGVAQWILGFGGFPGAFSDITHAGFLPGAFFDAFEPGGGNYILGLTLTFVFIDGSGNPTDINLEGKLDVAFRETYYNDRFPWGINTNFSVDVETIVLHETGHGLSQGHFGRAFLTNENGKIHFAPRAVMNAAYLGLQQELLGTDLGGHSSVWGSWPNR